MTHRKRVIHVISRSIMLAAFILGVASNTLVAAKAPEYIEPIVNAPAQAENELSTPELIEQAFVRGEITAEERILYLAYALYDYKSLPSQYLSNVGWFGTSYAEEIDAARKAAALGKGPSFSTMAEAEFTRLSAQDATVCDMADGPLSVDTPNFHLNYDPDTMGGELTILEYTFSLENSFSTEVTTYGWAKPPFCTDGMGTCTATNPWEKYPVQIAILGPGLYGRVVASEVAGSYTGLVGDNPNTSTTETMAVATCMVINSDFTGISQIINGVPLTTQQKLDRTTAHEFNHAIQNGYSPFQDTMWYESTSSYVEDEVFDAINGNYRFLWPDFTSCQGELANGEAIYRNWLFFRYAAEHNGGTNIADGGEDILQTFWANVASGETGLAAYNNALGTKGANLADTFHNYAIATRFTKSCPTASPYCFEEAAGYVAHAGLNQNHGEITSVGGSYSGTIEDNYAINWIGLPTSGIYTVTLENTSGGGELRGTIVADMGDTLHLTPLPQIVGSNSSTILTEYQPPSGANSVVLVLTNQIQTADDPTSCSVNSYLLSLASPPTPTPTGTPFACSSWRLDNEFRISPNEENPNRDFCNNLGVWEFKGSTSLIRNSATYPMSHDNFTPSFGGKQGLDFWFGNIVNGNGQFPAIGFNGSGLDIVFDQITFPANAVDIHPGPTQMGIIAWHSPLTGSVSITGGVSDNDPDTYCYGFGDGIKWYLDKNSTNLADGIISPGGSQDFANGNGAVNLNTVVVDTTDVIYLAIHPNGNYGCDNTRVDLSISVTGTPTATPIVTPIPTTVTPEPPPTSTPAPNCGCGANEVDNGCSIAASNQGVFHTVSYIQQAVIDLQLLHRVEDEILSQTPEGQHYIDLYYGHGMEIVEIIRSSPAIREEAIDTIQLWEPNLQALVDGEGNTAIITSGQVQAVQTFLDDLSALGSSELQQTIASERENMPLEQTIGTTMDQAWEEINPPDVDAGVDISTVAGTSVQFNGVIQNINPNTIQWNFGDGSTASGTLTPLHTYVNSGLYTVTLTVTDSAGSTISDTLLATVTPTSYTLVLQPNGSSGIDTYILSSSAASNYGAIVDMGVGEDNGGTNKTARSLIKFDLSSLPANATITSATLSLWTSQDLSSNTRTVRVYRLKQAFSETQATWNKATSTTSWQTVGASGANDRESTEVGSVQILDNVLLNTEKQIVLTPAKIQEMRNGTFTNNGFIIVADTETNDRFAYKTSDNTSATQRPKLVIQYTVPSTPDSIFADGFESGDFSHWSDSDWESGNLTVSTQSAAVGSDGMQAVITDTGSMQAEGPVNVLDASDPFYFNPNSVNTPHGLENLLAGTSDMAVYDTTPNDEKHYDARFYFDPNSINLPNGQGMYLFAGPNAQWAFCLYLERQGIDYRLSLCGKDDSNNWLENKFVYINDGWQAIEIEWQAANAPGANNGYMKLFINNVLVDTMKNLDTDTRSITDVALGVSGVPVGTTGTVYFDAFDSRRSSHIGPDANGPALQSPLTNLVFQDGFESGDLSSWAQSQLITDGGDLSVSSSAAMFGSYGLQALIDDTNVIYTKDFSPAAETHYSARVYFDPHSVSITNGQSFYILGNDNLRIRLKNNNGTYQLRASIYTDSGAWIDGTSIDISNSRQLLEVEWKTSSSSIANDGYLKFWINDSLIDTIPSVDNDTRVIENINVGAGATYVIPSGTSGTIYFDNFESRNGGHIGP